MPEPNGRDVDELLAFRSARHLVTSLYLDVDVRRHPRAEYVTVFKDLAKRRAARPATASGPGDADREQARSVDGDLARIEEYLVRRFERGGARGLAVFSCSVEGFFRAFPLPAPPRDRLVIEPVPYGRPLQALLESRRRVAVALVDQRRGRLFESAFGRLRTLEEIEHDVPHRVRAGGYQGYDERRIDRHVVSLHHAHYRDVAERLFGHWRREKFDHVVLAGPKEDVAAFEGHLHPFLEERVAGRVAADVGATRPVLEAAVETVEREIVRRDHDARLAKLFEQALRGGLGVLGLSSTLAALSRAQVRSLFVLDGFEVPGATCLECRALGVEDQVCPRCEKAMTPVADVIDEAVEEALRQGATVHAVEASRDDLARAGSIGALLRFRE